MDVFYVFSKSPLAAPPDSTDIIREDYRDGYRYTVRQEDAACSGFIFSAIVDNIAQRRLRNAGLAPVGDAGELTGTFSQKLAAYLCVTGSKNKIMEIVEAVLAENGVIDIDGLVTFRLSDFRGDIDAFFDMLFYEYDVRRQYDDFITLLRDYVLLEGPREAAIHIVFRGGGFVLYNSKMANITYSALKNYNNDSGFTEGNLNDFLISSLMSYLPEKIVLHTAEVTPESSASRIIETISLIFSGRVERCTRESCELCGEQPEQIAGFPGYAVYDDFNF